VLQLDHAAGGCHDVGPVRPHDQPRGRSGGTARFHPRGATRLQLARALRPAAGSSAAPNLLLATRVRPHKTCVRLAERLAELGEPSANACSNEMAFTVDSYVCSNNRQRPPVVRRGAADMGSAHSARERLPDDIFITKRS
jgi:hypothetical protein